MIYTYEVLPKVCTTSLCIDKITSILSKIYFDKEIGTVNAKNYLISKLDDILLKDRLDHVTS